MAKRGGGSGRKYVRDNRGRFSSTGATARGGRLKTASGKKRAVQAVKAKTGGKPAGALKAKPRSEGQKYAKRVQAGKDLKRSQSTAREKKFFAETQKRLDAAPLAQSRAARSKPTAAKPAAAKRRGAVGKISEAKAGRIVARMDAQRGRKALPGRRNANFARTAERRSQFILKPAATARNKGKAISVNESVQKAVANAAKRRKPKPAAAKARKARTDGDAFVARAKKARGTELRRYLNEGSRRDSLGSAQRAKTSVKVREAASQKREAKSRSTASRAKAFYQNFGSPSTFSRRDRKSTRDSDRFGSKKRRRS